MPILDFSAGLNFCNTFSSLSYFREAQKIDFLSFYKQYTFWLVDDASVDVNK